MAPDDHEPQDVAPFARDAAGHLDRAIVARAPAPDFAAMMLRARALADAPEDGDAAAAPVIRLRAAQQGDAALASVIPLGRGDLDAAQQGDAALASVIPLGRGDGDGDLDAASQGDAGLASVIPPGRGDGDGDLDAASQGDAALASVIPLGRGDGDGDLDAAAQGDAGLASDGDPGAGLGPFTAALRTELDAKIHARSLAGVPPLRPVPAPRRRVAGALLGVLVAAAAALLFAVGPALVRKLDATGRGSLASAVESDAPRTEGPARAPVYPRAAAGPAVLEDSSDAPGVAGPAVREDSSEVSEPAVRADSSEAPEAVPGDRPEAAPTSPAPAKQAGPRRRRPVVEDAPAPASLEDEAQALWQRGELAAAEQKFREVVRVAGRGRRAELAYGDLFALTRQMRGAAAQAEVWREYLERFPRGQFADDARAGLCQRAPVDARAACWRDYLVHHPDGAHRRQAAAHGVQEAP